MSEKTDLTRKLSGWFSSPEYKAKRKSRAGKTRERSEKERNYVREYNAARKFVALDSEGINIGVPKQLDGKTTAINHVSILWAAADRDGNCEFLRGDDAQSREPLWFWLTSLPEKFPHAIFVIFSGGYDVAQILRHLEYRVACQLAGQSRIGTRRWTRSGDYAFRYVRGKSLTIARYRFALDKNKPVYSNKIEINDVFGFFQCSFLKALKGFPGLCPKEDFERIKAGKDGRVSFHDWNENDVLEYTKLELKYLCAMMEELRNGISSMGLNVTRWQGAGCIAGAMYQKHQIKDHMFPMENEIELYGSPARMPPQAWGHYAFFGGRIELCQSGRTNDILHVYDIASAYPHIQRLLPSMQAGRFIYHRKPKRAEIEKWSIVSLIWVEWQFPELQSGFYPLPFRHDMSIIYPADGMGIYNMQEVVAAFGWSDLHGGTITIKGGYQFEVGCDASPFDFIPQYFEERSELNEKFKNGGPYDIKEKIIKLGINSLYGKTAQRVGGHDKPPPYANIFYATAITAGTRAALLNAASKDMASIVQFATDGIVSTRKLSLDIPKSKTLGSWEYSSEQAGCFVMSGLYRYGSTIKSRGFNPTSLINVTIEEMYDTIIPKGWKNGNETIEVCQKRYASFGMSAVSEIRWQFIGHWLDTTRSLRIGGVGNKRLGIGNGRRSDRLVYTIPVWRNPYEHISEPSRPDWLEISDETSELKEDVEILAGFN